MDGYAVRAADVDAATAESRPSCFRCWRRCAPASVRRARSSRASAIRVMTGAPVPDGADTVIRVEDTDGGEDARRHPRRARRGPQRSSARRGSSPRRPRRAARHGARPGAARRARVGRRAAPSPVHRRPRVAILASGDELVDVDRFDEVRARRPHRVVEQLHAQRRPCARAGAEPVVSRDRRPTIPAPTRSDFARAPGATCSHVGRRVRGRIRLHERRAAGARRRAASLARDACALARRSDSARSAGCRGSDFPEIRCPRMVTFELFARPLIRRLRGEARLFPRTDARSRRATTCRSPRRSRISCAPSLEWDDDGVWARLTGPQGSGLLTSMSRANALLVVPPDRPVVRARRDGAARCCSATRALVGRRLDV